MQERSLGSLCHARALHLAHLRERAANQDNYVVAVGLEQLARLYNHMARKAALNAGPPRSSAMPRRMALRERPVARETAVIPPQPSARASEAATKRRLRSSKRPATRAKRSLIAVVSSTLPGYTVPSSRHL